MKLRWMFLVFCNSGKIGMALSNLYCYRKKKINRWQKIIILPALGS